MKKILIIAVVAIIGVAALTIFNQVDKSTNTIEPRKLIKLRLGYMINPAVRPEVAVAIKNKYFEKYGIEVEINEFTSGDVAAQSLIGGKVDLNVISQTSYVKAAAAGAKIKSVGVVNSNTRWYFISRKEFSDITSYCTTGITTEDYLRGARELEKQGIDIKTLNVTNVSSIPLCAKAMASGSVDSLSMTEIAWENYKMQNKDAGGYKVIKKLYGEGYLKTPAAIIVTEDALINKKDAIIGFSKAMIEANYWLKTHTEAEIEKEIVGVVKITPTDAKIYSRVIKGQIEGIKFAQEIGEVEAIRKANEKVSPKLADYDVKNFVSTIISDELSKQDFLQKYGF